MIIKIDLEKASDCLEWVSTMRLYWMLGCPQRMASVIMECTSNASFLLLWNGECMDVIKQSKGLRQGDPISPYIFVSCMERLARIRKEVEFGNWKTL